MRRPVSVPPRADVATAGAPAAPATTGVERLWEIDLLRTLAIGMMVVYHLGYDIHLLSPEVALDPFSGGWRALQVACGSTFLGVVGISFWISNRRSRARGLAGLALWRRHARRAGQVLLAALAVSLATLLALGTEDYVRFGILHLIGATMLLLPLLARLGAWNALIGVGAVVAGLAIEGTRSDVPGALLLGLEPAHAGVDWYPLLPWAGAALIGVAIGALLYPDGRRGPLLARMLPPAPRGALLAGAPGRHALPIYLVHQPLLIPLTAAGLALFGAGVDFP